jgi:hypothetical protein
MSKKRCAHIGRIAERIQSGSIFCHRKQKKVQITVGEVHNKCTNTDCPLSGREIPRRDEE